jgi:hypothetical protein
MLTRAAPVFNPRKATPDAAFQRIPFNYNMPSFYHFEKVYRTRHVMAALTDMRSATGICFSAASSRATTLRPPHSATLCLRS